MPEEPITTAVISECKMPIGTIIPYAGDINPANMSILAKAGWLLCDGRTISREEFKSLFFVTGDIHGAGDFVSTFNLPDYRGRFLRGTDQGVGRDPDASSRQAPANGGRSGDNVGSIQGDSFRAHSHGTIQMIGDNNVDGVDSVTRKSGEHHNEPRRTSEEGGRENRPINAAVAWLILARV